MKKKKVGIVLLAVFMAVLMPVTVIIASSAPTANQGKGSLQKKYESPDINELTGMGQEPEDISVSAGATYQEKAWYEYVTYSDKAVCSYRIDDDHRMLFYDPYTYTNAMVMDVQFNANTTEFDTMSEYTISHSASKSISACAESTYTNTSATQTSGKDEYYNNVKNGGSTKTTYNYDEIHSTTGTVTEDTNYRYKARLYDTVTETAVASATLSSETGMDFYVVAGVGVTEKITISDTVGTQTTVDHNMEWYQDGVTNTTEYSPDYKTTITHDYESTTEDNTTSTTEGWEQLSARVTKTIGSSSSTSNSWSESESTTVTKTYAATHFASDGVTPLPWAIVHYSVQMPMKCCLQVKYSGEWVTISTVYCLLTTVQGTCRAWMQNGQVYYEDWGSGEPVVETQFWSQFMTKEQLMNAYSNKLYPVGGDN